jgi:Circadian oscillating protein COP23
MNFIEVKTLHKYRSLKGFLSILFMVGANSLIDLSSQAGTPPAKAKFVCAFYNGEFTTIAKTKKGDIPIVIWNSEKFSAAGFTPQIRCKQVSARFETLYRSGQLKHITAGTLNKMPAICATKETSGKCTPENLLYTLKSTEDPYSRVMMIRNREITARAMEKTDAKPGDEDTSIPSGDRQSIAEIEID